MLTTWHPLSTKVGNHFLYSSLADSDRGVFFLNLNNVRCKASKYFRDKKKEYLKDKINELSMNSKNKNIRDLYRGINDMKAVLPT
jgi:hypothetical protein